MTRVERQTLNNFFISFFFQLCPPPPFFLHSIFSCFTHYIRSGEGYQFLLSLQFHLKILYLYFQREQFVYQIQSIFICIFSLCTVKIPNFISYISIFSLYTKFKISLQKILFYFFNTYIISLKCIFFVCRFLKFLTVKR